MPKSKFRIGVLMGGPSAEREVSLVTGKAICENLNKNKFAILPIEMSLNGKLKLDINYYQQINAPSKPKRAIKKQVRSLAIDLRDNDVSDKKIDLVFIAMHGTYGEDGKLQGMLEMLNIPYTGSGVLASALAMDKAKSAELYKARGLLTPEFITINRKEWGNKKEIFVNEVIAKLGWPIVLKPTNQGSAVGVSIVNSREGLIKAINKTIKEFPDLIAQKFIKGKEATCGVLENREEPFALPPTHIKPNLGVFYDYKSKYAEGGSTHICPADFEPEVNKKIQELAVIAHQVLGCRGMSRSDFFVADDGNIYILETNTIPGMTATSLLPEAAAKAGISFTKMLEMIINASLN